MAWFAGPIQSQLDNLLDTRPTLAALFAFPDLMDQLRRSYNPKLIGYLNESPHIAEEMLQYLTVPPAQESSQQRKYKLPLYTMQMVRTETTCVLNCFFRPASAPLLASVFLKLLSNPLVLPLLAGYFARLNLILFTLRQQEAVDCLYTHSDTLMLLLRHPYSTSLFDVLRLYLLLDTNRHPDAPESRLNVKLSIIFILVETLRTTLDNDSPDATAIVHNVCSVFIDLVEKYYLKVDGRVMLDQLLTDTNCELFFTMVDKDKCEAVCDLLTRLLQHVADSSYNCTDNDSQVTLKNISYIQSLPLVKRFVEFIPQAANCLTHAKSMRIFHWRVIALVNAGIPLISPLVMQAVEQANYFKIIIEILFKYPAQSIIHKEVEKLFAKIFATPPTSSHYQFYRLHITERVDFIQATIARYMANIPNLDAFQRTVGRPHEGYFGHLMLIIRTYSEAYAEKAGPFIERKKSILQAFFLKVANPYSQVCIKKIGTYENIYDEEPIGYSIKYFGMSLSRNSCKQTIDEVNLEEEMLPINQYKGDPAVDNNASGKKIYDPMFDISFLPTPVSQNQSSPQRPDSQAFSKYSVPEMKKQVPQQEEPKDYLSFLEEKKKQAEKEIKIQRSNSREKLAGQRSRIMSPSPKRVNKWDTTKVEQREQQNKARVAFTKPQNVLPAAVRPPVQFKKSSSYIQPNSKDTHESQPSTLSESSAPTFTSPRSTLSCTPTSPRSVLSTSMVELNTDKDEVESKTNQMSKSMVLTSSKVRIKCNVLPGDKREVRKVNEKDNAFLSFINSI